MHVVISFPYIFLFSLQAYPLRSLITFAYISHDPVFTFVTDTGENEKTATVKDQLLRVKSYCMTGDGDGRGRSIMSLCYLTQTDRQKDHIQSK